MSSPTGHRHSGDSLNMNLFHPVSNLSSGDIELRLTDRFTYSDHAIPGYEFELLMGGQKAGVLTLLVESDFDKIADEGSIGLTINEGFRGRDPHLNILNALYPLLHSHGQRQVLITFDPGTNTIEATCKKLPGVFLPANYFPNSSPTRQRCTLDIDGFKTV